jgi:hypothetical protein
MKLTLAILAAYAFVGWNDADAACQKFKPDGIIEQCRSPEAVKANRSDLCQIGVMLAHRAYVVGTFDAQFPNIPKLHYLVDFYGDQLTLAHDRKLAHVIVEYIAKRMQKAGVRTPKGSPLLVQAEREILVKECSK